MKTSAHVIKVTVLGTLNFQVNVIDLLTGKYYNNQSKRFSLWNKTVLLLKRDKQLKSRILKAVNCIFRETIKEGKFEMKNHILVFLDDNGTEQSAPFTEVRLDGHFDSYQFEGVAYRFMQPMLEAIYNKKR